MSNQQAAQIQPFRCQYCQRDFKRLEHVQRHERTHTKEAPYQCPCGKAFPRGDLLRRHEKSAHNVDTTRRKRSSFYGVNTVPVVQDGLSPDVSRNGEPSLAAYRRSSSDPFSQPQLGDIGTLPDATTINAGAQDGSLSLSEQAFLSEPMMFGDLRDDPFDLFGEGDAFLENVDFSSLFLPAGFGLDPALQLDQSFSPKQDVPTNAVTRDAKPTEVLIADNVADPNSISRFGSPLPSIRDDPKAIIRQNEQKSHNAGRPVPCWKISVSDYSAIEESLAPLLPFLPNGFVLPSRHTVSRYLEGCIRGPYEHTPYLHIPTWSVKSTAPDLLLCMLAVGAQYKWENSRAVSLFYAAKAAISYQLRMKDARILGEFAQSSQRTYKPSRKDYNGLTAVNGESTTPPDTPKDEQVDVDRLQTMQAILTIMVLASWGPRQLVGEAVAFQSILAGLVREDGLGPENSPPLGIVPEKDLQSAWYTWVRLESRRRTKLLAYTFFNVQSVAFHISPCMLTTEVLIDTPAAQDVWNAETADAWLQSSKTSKIVSSGFFPAFSSLFQPYSPGSSMPNSALVNYALILAILQCIYLLRESSTVLPTANHTKNLRSEDLESLSGALQQWQQRWEDSPESTMEPVSTSGPVAFNSTALLRLAWIRLHADLGPCRNLASKDPNLIVEAFKSCPPLHRHAGLALPIVQAAHALSIPVRLGIAYVAKTQTISWSVQHTFSNLEAAIFLSKWFETVAATVNSNPLTAQEAGLITMIRRIVLETGFFREDAFEPANNGEEWQRLIRHLGTAVAKLWAQVFSGTHVFDVVSTIGSSLGIWTRLLEAAHTPIDANHV